MPSGDGKFTVQEFLHWYTVGRFQDTREGRTTGPRDGEGAAPRGPRDPG